MGSAPLTGSRRFWLIATAALGVMLNPLNTSMISVALVNIQSEFQVGFDDISWLIATYYIASAIAQPVMGKLSDALGPKLVFACGIALVTLSSILAPTSDGMGELLVYRIIQAVGTSAFQPAGMSIIRQAVTERQAQAISVVNFFSSTSAAFGPTIGGILLQFGGWPALFLINFPVLAVTLALLLKLVPSDRLMPREGSLSTLDLPGMAMFSLLMTGWFTALMSARTGLNVWLTAACLLGTIVFIVYEYKRKQPFVDVRFLRRNVQVCFIYAQLMVSNCMFLGIIFIMPSYMQAVRLFDAGAVGWIMLCVSGPNLLLLPFAGRWIDRRGYKEPLALGVCMVLVAAVGMLYVHEASPLPFICIILALFGASGGLRNLGLQMALYQYVRPEDTGIATGLSMTVRFIGTLLSTLMLGVLFAEGMTTAGLHSVAIIFAVMSVIIAILTWIMPKKGVRGE